MVSKFQFLFTNTLNANKYQTKNQHNLMFDYVPRPWRVCPVSYGHPDGEGNAATFGRCERQAIGPCSHPFRVLPPYIISWLARRRETDFWNSGWRREEGTENGQKR